MLDPILAHIISFGLMVLFVTSGIDKLKHRQDFSDTLTGYRLLPIAAVPMASLIIPVVEILLALCLLCFQTRITVIAIAGLLALYGAAIFINIRRGNLSLDCGCRFGESGQTISMALVYRNLLLVIVALLMLCPPVDRELMLIDYGVIVFGLSAFTLSYMTINRLIANATTYREVLS